MRKALTVLTLCLALATPASAADVEVAVNRFLDADHPIHAYRWHLDRWERFRQDCYHRFYSLQTEVEITVTGRIQDGDAGRFAALARPFGPNQSDDPDAVLCPDAIVILDSPGGEVREAIALGREIARLGFATVVLEDGRCLSACFFVLLGGSYMDGFPSHMVAFTGAEIGIHQPQFSPTARERTILGIVPEEQRIDQAFGLAGEVWKDITRYVIDERRASYAMQRLLASPREGDRFEYLDMFEEFYFAGIVPIDTSWISRTEAERETETARAETQTVDYVDAELARRLCALPAIKEGVLADLSDSYATRFAPGWIVGLTQIDRFCYVNLREGVVTSCLFDDGVFWNSEGQQPGWIDQWGFGVMGFYPVSMFDLTQEITLPPNEVSTRQIGDFLFAKFDETTLCQSEIAEFYVNELEAFERRMRLSTDCNSPTRLCE
jgi:hypothetical protein